MTADIAIHKQSADNAGISIEGAKYRLSGKSDYGTKVSEEVTTGAQGDAVFEGIEKGTYKLKETHSPDDWLLDKAEYTVKVDGAGKVTFNGKDERIVLKDSPRIHGDISFMKLSMQKGRTNTPVAGARFRLEGKSQYGTDVMEYAVSDSNGKVTFSNVEWGNYKLKEVSAPDGYILNRTEYDASVSDTGIGGISDAEMLTSGPPVIRNEPYHTVEISKQSSYDGSPLEGAEFKLTGTSDYGTPYDLKATSGSNGLATFKGLEAGTYMLQETKAPKGHIIDATKRAVRVSADGTYTIDGLELNDSGKYRQDNEKMLDGKIIVKKKWKDNKTNDQRPVPVIHITTDVKKVPTYAVWRNNYSGSAFYYVDPDYKDNVQKIEYADIKESEVPEDAVRMDSHYDDPNAKCKIYSWLKNGTMYYWTNAQTTRLTDGTHQLFAYMDKTTAIDLSRIDTSKMTNMRGMFLFCSRLTSLDLSSFDTSKVTNMKSMFNDCSSLTSLDLSHFNTSNVTNMRYMFQGCYSLASLDLSSFDTSKVTHMDRMFYDCSSLTSLDLSSFDTSNVTNMNYMFYKCSGLTNIYVSDRWNIEKVTSSVNMFSNCSKLPNYSSSSTDKTHANYGTDGYLTYKAYTSPAKPGIASDLMSAASSLAKRLMSYIITPVHAAGPVEYSSNDSKNCIITKDGDEWTYEFSVADDSAKYYAYEDDVDGYTSSNDASSYGVTTKDEPLTITNTANDLPEEPKPASLILTKSVDGKQLVTSDKPDTRYSHTSNIDDAGNANGRTYSNNLSTNDVVTIPGASRLHVKLYCSTESTSYDWACVWAGSHPDYTAYGNYSSSKLGTKAGKIGGGRKTSMSNITPIEGDIDGDTVTFGFRSDGSGQYYGYYAVVTGRDAGGNEIKLKEYSDVKTVTVPSRYASRVYMFDVTLSNSDSSKLSGTKIFGDTVFTDGKARVGVKPSEKKTFTGLPAGTTYAVEEEKYRWFSTESENAKGTLNAGDNKTVKFTNHYTPGKVLDYKPGTGFTLKKNVTGFFQKAQNYAFDVSFRKLEPEMEYVLSDGKTFTADDDGNGYVETSLGDGASVTFSKLPVGAQYRITESGGDWTSAYKITNASSDGDIAQTADSAEKNASLSTAWETVDAGEDITVDFTNTVKKYQNITLKKTVKGGDAPDRFRFRVDFSNLHDTVRSDAGTIVPEDDGTASAEVHLGDGEEMKFSNVPVTAKYQITELANAGTASYAITASKLAKASDSNSGPVKDLATAVETVDEGEDAVVEFTNTLPKSASVTLTKKVGGMFADPNRYFRFTVSLTGASANQDYLIDLTKGSTEHDGKKNPQFLKTDAGGRATADVWLKHGDAIALKNLPLDAKYSIAEEKTTGYETTVKANGADVTGISERSVQADSIVFVNSSGRILPTGMHRGHALVFIAAIDVVAIGAAAAFMLRRRKKKEN